MNLIKNLKIKIIQLKRKKMNYEILFITNLINQLDLFERILSENNIELLDSFEISFSDFYGISGISIYLDIFYDGRCFTIRISNHNCWQLGDNCVLNKIINHNDLIFINKKEIYDFKKRIRIAI